MNEVILQQRGSTLGRILFQVFVKTSIVFFGWNWLAPKFDLALITVWEAMVMIIMALCFQRSTIRVYNRTSGERAADIKKLMELYEADQAAKSEAQN